MNLRAAWSPDRQAIERYLDCCRSSGSQASVETARRFMGQMGQSGELSGEATAAWKAGLNWFFRQPAAGTGPPAKSFRRWANRIWATPTANGG